MPVLNQEILSEIAQEFIISGDQSKVYAFGLSGKQSWKVLKTFFLLIDTLKLEKDKFSIGWGKNQVFYDKVFVDGLMNCIGPSVKTLILLSDKPHKSLEINYDSNSDEKNIPKRKWFTDDDKIFQSGICKMIYLGIIKRIVSAKKLTNLKFEYDHIENGNLIFENLAKTIKHLELSSSNMKCPYNLKNLDLESFEVAGDGMGDIKSFSRGGLKTSTYTFSVTDYCMANDIEKIHDSSPLLVSVKTLIINIIMPSYYLNNFHFPHLNKFQEVFPFATTLILNCKCALIGATSITKLYRLFTFLSENNVWKIIAKIHIDDRSQEHIDPKWLEGLQRNDSDSRWILYSGNISHEYSEVEVKWKIYDPSELVRGEREDPISYSQRLAGDYSDFD